MPLPSYSPVIAALGWALLHSIWQALIICACLRLLLKFLKHAPAAVRYNLSAFAMAGIGAWFLLTFRQQWMAQLQEEHIRETILAAPPSQLQMLNTINTETGNGLAFIWPQVEYYLPYLVALYIAGLFFCCLRVGREWWALRRIRSGRLQHFDPAWEHHLSRLAQRLHLYKPVRLFLSEQVDVPLMIGHLKPAVYLPLALVSNLTPEQIEAILLHELAHIKRHDYLLNMLQTVVETILFFNPFVWWISRNIRSERENACDDMVVATAPPLTYARALVALEEYRRNAHFLAMAATGRHGQLFHRIKRMMEMKTKNLNYTQRLTALLLLGGSIASIAWLAPEKKTTPLTEEKTERSVPVYTKIQPAVRLLISPRITFPVATDTSAPVISQQGSAVIAGEKGQNQAGKPGGAPSPEEQQRIREMKENLDAQMASVKAQIDEASQHFDSTMSNIDWQKMQQEAQVAIAKAQQQLAKLNWEKMRLDMEMGRRQVDSAMRNIDWNKMQENVRLSMQQADSAMRNVDWNKMHENIRLSMWQADSAMRKTDWKKIRQETALAMEQAKKEMFLAQRSWNSSPMVINSGHAVNTNVLVSEMQRDGLLKNTDHYKIELNDKGLYINGKKQPKAVYKKYRNRIGDQTSLKISRKNGKSSTSINIESSK